MLDALPPPNAPLPAAPVALVARLEQTRRELQFAIAAWDPARPSSRAVVLLALYEQRLVRRAAARGLATRDPDVVATRELSRLSASTPRPSGRPRLGAAAPAARLLAWYREGERRFGIRWQLLAAVNFVESAFNRVRNTSGAGAQGPMQFEPGTWKTYGLGGDIDDPHDAIVGAANYLAANGGGHDARAALYRYNRSTRYDDAVIRYASQMRRAPWTFYADYNWQVYYRTAAGYRRLTGPR